MRIISYSLVLSLLACNESVIEKQDNTAPTILIGSHSPDAEILEGYIESFRANVSDDDNEFSRCFSPLLMRVLLVAMIAKRPELKVTPSLPSILSRPDLVNGVIMFVAESLRKASTQRRKQR